MKTLKLKKGKKEKKRTIHRFAQWNHTGEIVPKQFQHSWVALLKVLTNIPNSYPHAYHHPHPPPHHPHHHTTLIPGS